MKKFLAFDDVNGEHETFDTIEEAREYLKEGFFDINDGYHPDGEGCGIYELTEKVKYDVVAKKSDFSEEEWNEKYNKNFGEVWEHKFIKV